MMDTTTKQGAQTFARGLNVLKLLADEDGPVGLSDVARRLGIHKNAAYRLFNELEAQGLVRREDGGRRYVVGVELIALAAKLMRKVNLRGVASPAMERIRDLTGETVALHIRQGDNRVCVDVLIGTHQISRMVQVGETLPLFSGPTGKVQLAYLQPSYVEAMLRRAAEAGHDVETIRRQLAGIRALGYMASVGDRTAGIGGLSAPIFDAGGVVGSITVSGPGDRLTNVKMDQVAPPLVYECQQISAAMGYAVPIEPPGVAGQERPSRIPPQIPR
jgi:DNA-binding IclR family transcriptional regulator